jgi:ribonuclease BN (tRNA processing enzyme)
MSLRYAVLASGSSGNAAVVRAAEGSVLIDLGLGPRCLDGRLRRAGADAASLSCALLTHTHRDHIHRAGLTWLRKRRVRLICHESHREHLAASGVEGFAELDADGLVGTYDDRPFLAPNGLRVEPVALSHDSGPTFGFRIEGRNPGARRSSAPVALAHVADTGAWSGPMADALADVTLLGLEFNHDEYMQRTSSRPRHLIHRNLGPRGHLSNRQAAGLVRAILERSRPDRFRHLVLLHMSQQCNAPELAVGAAEGARRESGRWFSIHPSCPRFGGPDLVLPRAGSGRRPAAVARSNPELSLFPWERDEPALAMP